MAVISAMRKGEEIIQHLPNMLTESSKYKFKVMMFLVNFLSARIFRINSTIKIAEG